MSLAKKTFPTVGGYTEAFAHPTGRFATLEGLQAVTDADGGPEYVSGTGRVTFRVLMDGEPHALTCFTSSSAAATAASGIYGRLLKREVYVFNHDGNGDYYAVAVRPVCVQMPEAMQAEQESGDLYEGLRIIVRDRRFGFEDEAGNVTIEPRYAWAGDFSEGRATVAVSSPPSKGMLMGLIDRAGNEVIAPKYDDLSWDGSRYAYVDMKGMHGCLDRTGGVVVPLEYERIGEFNYGFAVVMKDGWLGYVDESGTLSGEGLAFTEAWAVGRDGLAQVLRPGGDVPEIIRLF